MRKWISIILVIILILGFAACGKKNKKTDAEPANDPAGNNAASVPESGDNDTAVKENEATEEPDNSDSNLGETDDNDNGEGNTDTDPAQGNVLPDPGLTQPGSEDPADNEEDMEDEGGFTGLDSEDETIINLEENQGVGGF